MLLFLRMAEKKLMTAKSIRPKNFKRLAGFKVNFMQMESKERKSKAVYLLMIDGGCQSFRLHFDSLTSKSLRPHDRSGFAHTL